MTTDKGGRTRSEDNNTMLSRALGKGTKKSQRLYSIASMTRGTKIRHKTARISPQRALRLQNIPPNEQKVSQPGLALVSNNLHTYSRGRPGTKQPEPRQPHGLEEYIQQHAIKVYPEHFQGEPQGAFQAGWPPSLEKSQSRLNLPEESVHEGRLSGPRAADDAHSGMGRHVECQAVEHRLVRRGILNRKKKKERGRGVLNISSTEYVLYGSIACGQSTFIACLARALPRRPC